MTQASVFTPLFDDDGVRSVNFFNGRVLSGEDLTTERRAERAEHRRLARGLGEGIVHGLHVQALPGDTPTVNVSAGMAFDKAGDSVHLPHDADVSLLALKRSMGEADDVEPFKTCTPPQAGTYVVGSGVYLLTVRRALGTTGFAPVSGLGNELAGCNRRYVVEGVEFRLSQVAVPANVEQARLRNQLAYACFGAARLATRTSGATANLAADDDLLAPLRRNGTIGDCDVPLALVQWRDPRVEFVDMWSVRRRSSAPTPAAASDFVTAAQMPAGEARLLQFQAQLAELVSRSSSPSTLVGRTHFAHLPAAAFLPITGVSSDGTNLRPAASSRSGAVDYERFFGDRMKARPRVIEGARVPLLVRESLSCPPIDLDGDQMFWLFAVRENMQAVEQGRSAVPYLIVASPHLRFQAEPRFDVSYSDYANFL